MNESTKLPLPAPAGVIYTFTDAELKSLLESYIKEQTGIDVDLIVDYDSEVINLMVYINGDEIYDWDPDDICGKDKPLCHLDEWFINAMQIVSKIFGNTAVATPIISSASDSNSKDFDIDIIVPKLPR